MINQETLPDTNTLAEAYDALLLAIHARGDSALHLTKAGRLRAAQQRNLDALAALYKVGTYLGVKT